VPPSDGWHRLSCSNINQSNVACYASPKYDSLYKESQLMRDSAERSQLFERMPRQFEADTPWRLGVAAYRSMLAQPLVIGDKAHPVLLGEWIYVNIDAKVR
jgi:hypothetical protein